MAKILNNFRTDQIESCVWCALVEEVALRAIERSIGLATLRRRWLVVLEAR